MFVKCAEKTELPGYGFFRRGGICPSTEAKEGSRRKTALRRIKNWRVVICYVKFGAKMEIPVNFSSTVSSSLAPGEQAIRRNVQRTGPLRVEPDYDAPAGYFPAHNRPLGNRDRSWQSRLGVKNHRASNAARSRDQGER